MQLESFNEVNLIEKLAGGDEQAFNEIYDRYRHRVYGFIYRMTINQAVAEDLTHETFLVLIEHPHRYCAERGSLLTFLCAVARNFVMNHLRRKGQDYLVFDEFEEFDLPEIKPHGNPLKDLLNQELAAQIDNCIAALPPLQREVIILREYEQLSYEEIAGITEAGLAAVKTRLHRARQSLARELAAYLEPQKKSECYELR